MRFIQRRIASDGQAHAVHRQGIAFADGGEVLVKTPTGHHVVFCVHFKKPESRIGLKNVAHMLWLQSQPGLRGQRCVRGVVGVCHGHVLQRDQLFLTSLNSLSWPKPVDEVGEVVFSQLPLAT